MAETPRGIIYPESNAHTRLWEHFQALASSADDAVAAGVAESKLSDSGWTNIPYASGWTTAGGGSPLAVRKIGKIVYARGRVTSTGGSIPVTNGTTIGTLPAGFLPGGWAVIFAIPTQNPATSTARVIMNTTGSISLYTYNSTVPYVSLDVSYPAA